MYEHSFTIEDVAWLLSIRRLDDGTRQDFPVECPFCGDTRGKCSFCISKNGEQKNVYHCFHCDASGNMLSLYADLMGFYGADRYKEAYQDILRRLERKRTCFPKMKASTFLKPKEKLQSPEYLDYVYRNMLALLELKEVHKKDLKRRSLTEWEIQELMDKGYRSTEPEKSVWIAKKLLENGLTLKGVPGFFQNRDGNWEAAGRCFRICKSRNHQHTGNRRNPKGRNRQFAKRSSVHRNSRCWKLPKLTACTIRSETAWP